jgi:hypothetical protein
VILAAPEEEDEVHQRADRAVQSHHQAESQVTFEWCLHGEQMDVKDQSSQLAYLCSKGVGGLLSLSSEPRADVLLG